MINLQLTIIYNENVIKKNIYIKTLDTTIAQIKNIISNQIFISKKLDFVTNVDILHMNKHLYDNTLIKDIHKSGICYLTIFLYNSKL